MELGENIRAIRQRKNMSQVQLACKIGKANTFLCDIEKCRATPSLKTIKKIAEALEVDITELFKD